MVLYPFPVSPLELLGFGSGPMFVAEHRGRAYYRAWPTGTFILILGAIKRAKTCGRAWDR